MTQLTKTERLIYDLAVLGLSNQEIGDKLCIAKRTARDHLTNIFKKAGVHRRSQLIAAHYLGKLNWGPRPQVLHSMLEGA